MKFYKTTYDNTIKEVDVEKQTKCFIYISEHRVAKRPHQYGDHYFPTWQEAFEYLFKRASVKVESAKKSLRYQEKILQQIIDMGKDNDNG